MKKLFVYAIIVCMIISCVLGTSVSAFAQESSIPQWVKNNAKLWSEGQISESEFIKGIQYLIDNNILRISSQDEINKLMTSNAYLQNQSQNFQNQLQQNEEKLKKWEEYGNKVQSYVNNVTTTAQSLKEIMRCQSSTYIVNQTINWNFCDSKGNQYGWSMLIQTYDNDVKKPYPSPIILNMKMPDNSISTAIDYRSFIEPRFTNVIDQVYDNAGSDNQFLYELWYIVSQMTTYNKDITNSNLWPLEVFTRSGGDCKDLSILLVSMIKSSQHTKGWDVYLGYVDSDHISEPQTINHMLVSVHINGVTHIVETTNKQDGLNYWGSQTIDGWWYPVNLTS